MLSVQALLSAPNPDDPLAADVAKHYKVRHQCPRSTSESESGVGSSQEDPAGARGVSRQWTLEYASN